MNTKKKKNKKTMIDIRHPVRVSKQRKSLFRFSLEIRISSDLQQPNKNFYPFDIPPYFQLRQINVSLQDILKRSKHSILSLKLINGKFKKKEEKRNRTLRVFIQVIRIVGLVSVLLEINFLSILVYQNGFSAIKKIF